MQKTRNTAYNRLRKTNNGTFRAYSDTSSRTIGLSYEQKGSRKAAILRVLLPFVTRNGNTVPTDVRLTGAQARRLYEFLSAQYEAIATNTAAAVKGTNSATNTPPATPVRRKRSATNATKSKLPASTLTVSTSRATTTKRKRNA